MKPLQFEGSRFILRVVSGVPYGFPSIHSPHLFGGAPVKRGEGFPIVRY